MFSGGTVWRGGLAVSAAMHLAGFIVPQAVLVWNAVPVRLYLLEGSGFLVGVLIFVGWVQVMRQHFRRGSASTRAVLAEIADCALLSLLCVTIVSGLVTAITYRWGSSWSASTLSPYVASLVHGAPETRLIENMPFLVRLHVLSWFALILLVPFTSASLILIAALDRGVAGVSRPIDAATEVGRRVLVKLSPAKWLWPEEDEVELPGKVDNTQEL
jgi:nitrate reductase gamma subunit